MMEEDPTLRQRSIDYLREHAAELGTMNNARIIPIEEKMPHKVSEVICVRCCRRWIDVRPEGTPLKSLECPGCGQTGCVIETGEEIDDK